MFIFLDAEAPGPQSIDFATDVVLAQLPTKAGIQVMTAANNFYPVVEFHVHGVGPPPPTTDSWEEVFETYLEVQIGMVQLMNEIVADCGSIPLDPGLWNLHAHLRGREAAKQRWINWDPNEPQFMTWKNGCSSCGRIDRGGSGKRTPNMGLNVLKPMGAQSTSPRD